MAKLHNRYRRAKRFELDEDGDVVDKFSGNRSSHVKRGWDFYDHRRNRLWDTVGKAGRRFFQSKVGQHWDTAYSDFCQAAKSMGEFREFWVHDRMQWGYVEQNVVMEGGYPYSKGRWGKSALRKGEIFIHPETKIVSVAKGLNVPVKPARPKQEVEVGEVLFTWKQDRWDRKPNRRVTFKLRNIAYNRKVACGVTEEVVDKVWFKEVPYLHASVDRYGKFVGRDDMGCAIYEAVTRYEVRHTVTTASKQEIKQHKLNENS